ncbi:tyrosine-type recombinase/integrase [Nocardioides albidus]
MASSVVTLMHGVRGYFRFAHIDGLTPTDPAVYARLPEAHRDESRTQGLDWLELIRFLQVAQTITVHHGALAYLLGINALRASEAAAVRIEDYAETLRGHRVLHLVGKGNKPATMPITVPVLRVLEACRGERSTGPLILRPLTGKPVDRRDVYRMVQRIARAAAIPRHTSPHSPRRHHQRPRRWRPAARRPNPRPARRPAHHRTLRPGTRQPRPPRRALPHRLRRRPIASAARRPLWASRGAQNDAARGFPCRFRNLVESPTPTSDLVTRLPEAPLTTNPAVIAGVDWPAGCHQPDQRCRRQRCPRTHNRTIVLDVMRYSVGRNNFTRPPARLRHARP